MSAFFMADGNIPCSIDLLNIMQRGCMILCEIFFSSILEMLSNPLLVFWGSSYISVFISLSVQGCKNNEFVLLSILFKYSCISSGVDSSFSAYFAPIVEKNSQKVFVMLYGSYLSVGPTLMHSINWFLLFSFFIILFISCHNFLLSCLYSVHLSCRYLVLHFLIRLFSLFLCILYLVSASSVLLPSIFVYNFLWFLKL